MPEKKNTEKEIVAKARIGDKQALSEIVTQNEQLVYNTALRLLANPEEAECVLQETFLKVFQAIPEFKGDSSVSTWIYRIATNFALMRLRNKKKNFSALEGKEDQVNKSTLESFNRQVGNNPLRAVMNQELRGAMDIAISELPQKFRSVFILKDVEGYSLKEIAGMTQLSLAAVKSNLHRARLFLRNRLAEYTVKEGAEI